MTEYRVGDFHPGYRGFIISPGAVICSGLVCIGVEAALLSLRYGWRFDSVSMAMKSDTIMCIMRKDAR